MSYDVADLNVSNGINATTADTELRNLMRQVSLTNPVIVRVTIFLILAVFNVGGNGFTLVTIRLTPRLWTKTNFILASMMVVDIISGVSFLFWYTPFLLIVYVYNNPCHYNVAVTIVTPLMKMTAYVNVYHMILMSIERYIAIVHPLKYETKFTDRTLKWAIAAAWATGIFIGTTFMFWLINADLRMCDLVPVPYQLLDVVLGYIPACVCMFFVYRKILAIWWHQRKRIDPINDNPAPGTSVQLTAVTTLPVTQSGEADNTQDPKELRASTGPSSELASVTPASTRDTTSTEVAEQQRQSMKSRRREFKAVYLTAAIVGMFVILWFPHSLARVLVLVGYNPIVVNYIGLASGAIGASNFAFAWVIYAAVSKSYRRAYRQLLIRVGCCCCKNITMQVDSSFVA